ncbi:MAG TPA: hypothetical protein DDX06_11405 [Curvibacter sp.]|nr:hypothetical protein [Curvibacter sp.]|tara:strand:- start:9 stop:1151 length:1143 start_codon:yes stop_codon:yes gene_type:complete
MWFVFALITLVSFSVYFGIKRYEARWHGMVSFLLRGRAYQYEFVYKHKSKSFRQMIVGVDAPKEFDFTFKRESGIDRIFKWLGISVEKQFSTPDFDRLVYVASNDGHLFDEVMDDHDLLGTVIELFKIDHFECRISHLHCRNGRLWVIFKVGGLFNDESNRERLRKVFPQVAESLHSVADVLKQNLPKTKASDRDPFILRAILVLAISTGLVINGLVHAFRLMLLPGTFTLDTTQLWLYATFAGGGILVLLIALAIGLLGRSARAHLVFIELLLVGSLGAVLTAFTELRDVNIELDSSVAQQYEAKVLDMTISRSRRSGTQYYLHIVDWTGSEETRRIHVSSDFYRLIQKGERIRIWQRRGFLGIRWVAAINRVDPRVSP